MKVPTVNDLSFRELTPGLFCAKHSFNNGYAVIIRYGKGTATTVGARYEIQIVPSPPQGHPYLSDDIVGYSTADDVNMTLQEVSHLKTIQNQTDNVTNPKFDW